MNLRFYYCEVCGKVIAILPETEIPTVCCGQPMQELTPNKTDGAAEKHVPVFSTADNAVHVQIGSLPHPMTENHSIRWIGLCTSCGFHFKELQPADAPEALFLLPPEEHVRAVYAYCNLHGLWVAE